MAKSSTSQSSQPSQARWVASLVAALLLNLTSGTIYMYSTFGPQMNERLKYNDSQSTIITSCGSYGLYLFGPIIGTISDRYGPKVNAFLGAMFTLFGYGMMSLTVNNVFGESAKHFGLMTLYYTFCGIGSACSYSAGLSTVVKNSPENRLGFYSGLGVGFLALSGLVFTTLKKILFNESEKLPEFFLFLAFLIAAIDLLCLPFVKVFPPQESSSSDAIAPRKKDFTATPSTLKEKSIHSMKSTLPLEKQEINLDLQGWAFIQHPGFIYLFLNFIIVVGVGMMYIIKVGSVLSSLSYGDKALQTNAATLHSSFLSIGNFLGRVLSGLSSDWAKRRFGINRVYFLAFSSLLMTVGISSVLLFDNLQPTLLLSSVMVAIAYGFTFSVTPTLMCEWFGRTGYAFKWGLICYAPAIGNQVFSQIYSFILDSKKKPCYGLSCHRDTFILSAALCLLAFVAAIVVSLKLNQVIFRREIAVRLKKNRMFQS